MSLDMGEKDQAKVQGTLYENFVLYTKNDINLSLLKDFEYSTRSQTTAYGRKQTVYICKHDDCNKEFLRTCNLLDHVRMHSGIKPHVCNFCDKTFTQKSNLRKHLKVHLAPELDQRKRYSCEYCDSKYTERYNFKVRSLLVFDLNSNSTLIMRSGFVTQIAKIDTL